MLRLFKKNYLSKSDKENYLNKMAEGAFLWNEWRAGKPEENIDLSGINLKHELLSRRYMKAFGILSSLMISLSGIALNGYFFFGSAKLSNRLLEQIESKLAISLSLSFLIMVVLYLITRFIIVGVVGFVVGQIIVSMLGLNTGADLTGIDLSNANLTGADLREIDLSYANLKAANLSSANLSYSEAIGANFSCAILTGVCVEGWNIDPSTNLSNVICDYIYQLNGESGEFVERRPVDPDRNFSSGEFAILMQKALTSYEIAFTDGIDWKIFLLSFEELRSKYGDENISVQAIEKKGDGAFVIRLETTAKVDKVEIEKLKQDYESKLYLQEERLKLQGERMEFYQQEVETKRKENSNLLGVVEKMAENQGSGNFYNLPHSKWGGGFATEGGLQTGGTLLDISSTANLSEAAQQIQELLRQLQEQDTALENAQEEIAKNLAQQAETNPTVMGKLVQWGKSLADTAGKTAVSEAAKGVIKLALQMAGIPLP